MRLDRSPIRIHVSAIFTLLHRSEATSARDAISLYSACFQMSAALFDLIILWSPDASDTDYSALQSLLNAEISPRAIVHAYHACDEAIIYLESRPKSSLPLVVITKLGKTNEDAGEKLIDAVVRQGKRTFIILHSYKAFNDANLR